MDALMSHRNPAYFNSAYMKSWRREYRRNVVELRRRQVCEWMKEHPEEVERIKVEEE